jgi:Tfp pilus assembly protein PilN
VKKAQTDLRSAQAELAALPAPPPARSATDSQLATQQGARLAALSTALSRRVAWDRILREISLVLPDDVFLQSLKAKSPASGSTLDPPPTPTAAATAQGLVIQGTTYSHDSVARLLSRLQVIPDLTNVQLVDSSQTSIGGTHIAHFVIDADVRMPGSA